MSDLSVKRRLLIAGLGWGYMPIHRVSNDIAGGVLRRLWIEDLRDENTVTLIVVRRRDRVLGPAARWMLAHLTNRSFRESLLGAAKGC